MIFPMPLAKQFFKATGARCIPKERRKMKPITIGVLMLIIFAGVSSEARIALEIALSITFTLALFVSILLGMKNYMDKSETETEEVDTPEGESSQEQTVPNIPQEQVAQGD